MKTITKKLFQLNEKHLENIFIAIFRRHFRAIFMAALAKILNCTSCMPGSGAVEAEYKAKSIKANKQAPK